MYQVLARKYRPQTFAKIIGQKGIVNALQKSIRNKRIHHAFLFSGPRGIGKTTTARIFAKALNCIHGPAEEPCNNCQFCQEINSDTSLDFLEIDGASNRGIDEVRTLRETALLQPAKCRFRIYLIDEVHMLTTEAFNALLKILEEPPEYVKFIFATTSPEKIPPTIISRCQHYEFKPLRNEEITAAMEEIVRQEGCTIEPEALTRVVEAGAGSVRDILGYLDQLIVVSPDNNITLELVFEALGLVPGEAIWKTLHFLVSGDAEGAISFLHELVGQGVNLPGFLSGLAGKLRILLWHALGIRLPADENSSTYEQFVRLKTTQLVEAAEMVMATREKIRYEPLEVILVEVLLLKIIRAWQGVEDGKQPTLKDAAGGVGSGYQIKKKKTESAMEEKPPAKKMEEKPSQGIPEADHNKKAQDFPEENPTVETDQTKKEQISGEVSAQDPLAEIASKWQELLDRVKKIKRTLEPALREGRPVSIADGTLSIEFPARFRFHCDRVNEKAHKKIVEEALARTVGTKYNINCFVAEQEKKRSPLDDPSVKDIISFFDGQIVEMEE
jgi:DNA polymerase-3 subunit gamma/tau